MPSHTIPVKRVNPKTRQNRVVNSLKARKDNPGTWAYKEQPKTSSNEQDNGRANFGENGVTPEIQAAIDEAKAG